MEGGFAIKPIETDKPGGEEEKLRAVEREFIPAFREVYRIKEKIGHGAYANVYSGTHIKSGTDIAIKHMKDIEYSLSYLLAELKLLEYLKHKNISKLYDIWPAERTTEERVSSSGRIVPPGRITGVYVVMELMESDLKRLYESPTTFNPD
jgi:serine/threonine protein kinase